MKSTSTLSETSAERAHTRSATWHVRWSGDMLLGPDGKPLAIGPGEGADIAVAHAQVDAWSMESGLFEGFRADDRLPVWWFLRFEIVHDFLSKALPYLRALAAFRSVNPHYSKIVLHDPPDAWWHGLFIALFPNAEIRVSPCRKRVRIARLQKIRRLFLRLVRGVLSEFRLLWKGTPKKDRVLVVQQARYWRSGADTFWGETVQELEKAGLEVVPFVMSHLDFSDDWRPLIERPRQTLFGDMLLWRGIATKSFWNRARQSARPQEPLIIHDVDLTPLVCQIVERRYASLCRTQDTFAETTPRLLQKLQAKAMLLLDENGGEWALKMGGLTAKFPVISVQHGVIHADHLHYIYPSDVPPESVPLCDITCVRGPCYSDLLTEQSIYPKDRVKTLGSLVGAQKDTPSDAGENVGEALRDEVLPARCTRLLLFTSQDLLFPLVSEPLLSALAKSSEENFLVIRPHPREFSVEPWNYAIRRLGLEDRVIIRRDASLEAWLDACDIHLSGSSTALEEAVFHGKPNIVVGARMLGDWLGVLEGDVAVALDDFDALDSAVAACEQRSTQEIAKARERYRAGRAVPSDKAVTTLVETVSETIKR